MKLHEQKKWQTNQEASVVVERDVTFARLLYNITWVN
jgi:hypothetical protein